MNINKNNNQNQMFNNDNNNQKQIFNNTNNMNQNQMFNFNNMNQNQNQMFNINNMSQNQMFNINNMNQNQMFNNNYMNQNQMLNNNYMNQNQMLNNNNINQNQMLNNINQNQIFNNNINQNQIFNNNFNQNQMFNNNNNQNQMFHINNLNDKNMNMNIDVIEREDMNHQFTNKEEEDDDIYANEPEDIYPYIKEPKKEIIIVKSDLKRKKVFIPETLKKNELYYTSRMFKCQKYSTIKLLHNTEILDDDDTSIECISNGDIIKINECLDIDSSFYKSLLLKHKNSKKIRIGLFSSLGNVLFKDFPIDITIIDMIKVFLTEMGIPFKNLKEFSFIYNGEILNKSKKNELLKDCLQDLSRIEFVQHNMVTNDPFNDLKIGKILNFNINNCNYNFTIGTLAQIKEFYNGLKIFLSNYDMRNKKIDKVILNPGNIEIRVDDERTFSSIGIRENFECKIDFVN